MTKKFKIQHQDKKATFKLFLSKHQGLFIASVLYFTKEGEWGRNNLVLNFELENFSGNTEDEAIEKAKKWIDGNLGKNYEIESIK